LAAYRGGAALGKQPERTKPERTKRERDAELDELDELLGLDGPEPTRRVEQRSAPTVHDFTHSEAPRPSRWDTAGSGAVPMLDSLLVKAGLPGRLATPLALMDRAEELVRASDREREAARERLAEAGRRLLAGGTDVAEYARVVAEAQVWISEGSSDAGPAGYGVGDVARLLRGNAVQTVFAMADGLHAALRDRCAEAVDSVASVPLPKEIFSATSIAHASTLAIREGFGDSWGLLVKAADAWDACHGAAALLQECGSLQHQLQFAGPTSVCVRYLNWQDVLAGLDELKRIPGPLKIRWASDHHWRPGCYLLSDHENPPPEPKRRGSLAELLGR
jgi:hypothetical protein